MQTLETHRGEVDGIPVFWGEDDDTCVAALMFRVGSADEPLVMRGVTHLAEHLAFTGLGSLQFPCNAVVEDNRTVFFASGTEDEVYGFLGRIGAALRELPLERFAKERRILAAESMGRETGFIQELLFYRYGAATYGLAGVEEFGLRSLDEEAVTAWARERFTTANAALCLNRKPPATLGLELPRGTRLPLPPANTWVPPEALPGWLGRGDSDAVSVSFLTPPGPTHAIAMDILGRRLYHDLREERAVVYGIAMYPTLVSNDTVHVAAGASSLPQHAADVREGILGCLDALADPGPTETELAEAGDRAVRGFTDRNALMGMLDLQARLEITGRPVRGDAELLEEIRAVTIQDVRDVFARARATLLVLGPESLPLAPPLHPFPVWSSRGISGAVFLRKPAEKTRRWSLKPAAPASSERLFVGEEGVGVITSDGNLATVPFEDCVGVVHEPGDLRDVWGVDGTRIRIDPSLWTGGESAVARVDAMFPAHLVVPAPEVAPAPPPP